MGQKGFPFCQKAMEGDPGTTLQQWSLMSDKRQQALGGVDKPEENWIYHPSKCSIWGWSKRLFWWLCSFLLRITELESVCPSHSSHYITPHRSPSAAKHQFRIKSRSHCRCTYTSSSAGPLNNIPINEQSRTLQLILERKRRQDKHKRTKIRQCICVTSKLVNHGQREVWKFLLCPKVTKQPYPGPLSASEDWVRESTVEHHLR